MSAEWTPVHLAHWRRQPAFARLQPEQRLHFVTLLTLADRHGALCVDPAVLSMQLGLSLDLAEALLATAQVCDAFEVSEVDGALYARVAGYDTLLSPTMIKNRPASSHPLTRMHTRAHVHARSARTGVASELASERTSELASASPSASASPGGATPTLGAATADELAVLREYNPVTKWERAPRHVIDGALQAAQA